MPPYRLAGAISHYQSNQIATVDWGYLNGLRMLYGGNLRLTAVSDYMRDNQPAKLLSIIRAPDSIFYSAHRVQTAALPRHKRSSAHSRALADGYSEELLRVVHDNEGRPMSLRSFISERRFQKLPIYAMPAGNPASCGKNTISTPTCPPARAAARTSVSAG